MRGSHGWAEVDRKRKRKRELIRAIAWGRPTRGPLHVELDLTDRCNVACYFCNQQDVRTKEQISLPHVVALIDELAATGLKSVRLSGGGDPLAHHDAGKVLDHLHARGVVVDNLTTNGALLTGPRLERDGRADPRRPRRPAGAARVPNGGVFPRRERPLLLRLVLGDDPGHRRDVPVLKNMYFRGDQEFYAGLERALVWARRRSRWKQSVLTALRGARTRLNRLLVPAG